MSHDEANDGDVHARLRRAAVTLDAAAERHLDQLASAQEPVQPSGSRRWLVTAGAAATLVAGVVAVAVLAIDDETSAPIASGPAETETTAGTDPSDTRPSSVSEPVATEAAGGEAFTRALERLGVDLATAPAGALQVGGEYCGVDRWIDHSVPPETDAQRCLADAYEAGARATAVTEQITIEGDPIITVYRADPDGHLKVFADSTRDAFGSGEWDVFECDGVTFGRDGLRLRGCDG